MYPYGDQWYQFVPAVHRIVADPAGKAIVVKGPRGDQLPAWWMTAYYVAKILAGWQSVGIGVLRVEQVLNSAPDHEFSAPVDVLLRTWGREGVLAMGGWSYLVSEGQANSPDRVTSLARRSVEDLEAVMASHGFYGGTDPYHIGHIHQVLDCLPNQLDVVQRVTDEFPPIRNTETVLSFKTRRIAATVRTFEDWPVALGAISQAIDAGQPAWHLLLTSVADGWLGEFKRCWECGGWFMGRALDHKLGHA